MSTTPATRVGLKLDASAVALLFADPVARVELQRAVVAEFCRQLWPNYLAAETRKQLTALLDEAKPELLAITRDEKQLQELVSQRIQSMKANLRGQVKLGQVSDELATAVDARIWRVIEDRVNERLGTVTEVVDQVVDRAVKRVQENLDRRVDAAVGARVAQEVEARIAKMRAAL